MNLKSLSYAVVAVVILGALYMVLKPKEGAQIPPAPTSAAAPPAVPAAAAPAVDASGQPAAADPYAQPAPVPATQAAAPTKANSIAQAPASAEAAAKPYVFEIVLRNGRRVSGPAVLKVKKDDDVTLSITSDKADQLHLHGYDLRADLSPGKTATLNFKAKLTGRFAYELHHAGTEVGALEVYPR